MTYANIHKLVTADMKQSNDISSDSTPEPTSILTVLPKLWFTIKARSLSILYKEDREGEYKEISQGCDQVMRWVW